MALIINKMLGSYNYLDLNLNKISKGVFIKKKCKSSVWYIKLNTGFTTNQSLQALQISSTPIYTAA